MGGRLVEVEVLSLRQLSGKSSDKDQALFGSAAALGLGDNLQGF